MVDLLVLEQRRERPAGARQPRLHRADRNADHVCDGVDRQVEQVVQVVQDDDLPLTHREAAKGVGDVYTCGTRWRERPIPIAGPGK